MTLAGSEPAVPAGSWPQTLALDHSATGIGQTEFNTHTKLQEKLQFFVF